MVVTHHNCIVVTGQQLAVLVYMFPFDDSILDSVFRSYGLFVIACYVEKVYEYNLMQNLMWKALHGVVKLLSKTNVIVNIENISFRDKLQEFL